MGWFWASSDAPTKPQQCVLASYFWIPENAPWLANYDEDSCSVPVTKPRKTETPVIAAAPAAAAGGCPVRSKFKARKEAEEQTESARPSKCPVNHAAMNKLNNMPSNLESVRLPGQKTMLPTERTVSAIPKGDTNTEGFWEYPSPQQMLAAMIRKDKRDNVQSDIDETAVEGMVDVHNFLNDGVWKEVLEWEKPYSDATHIQPRLLKFQGRPGELSPRARFLQFMGAIYPSRFGMPPPFDRHDWTVLRAVSKADPNDDRSANSGSSESSNPVKWKQVRYVIDFYEIPNAEDGDSVFTVDVRPALDSVGSAIDRLRAPPSRS